MDKKLTWRELKALDDIYNNGFSLAKIDDHDYIKYLIKMRFLRRSVKNMKRIDKASKFDKMYEKDHLENYTEYLKFLQEHDLLNTQSRYTEDDIQALNIIKEQKDVILKAELTKRQISTQFFKVSKRIEQHPGLGDAIKKLLGIEKFPEDEKDFQYMFVVDCKNPNLIILCENLNFLKLPWKARKNNIKLWYAGGNNLEKLSHIDKIEYPIYYSCDWDDAGLKIYERIKKNYIPDIVLLNPVAILKKLDESEDSEHKSQWRKDLEFSGLTRELYTSEQVELIEKLIKENLWIEEEQNDFEELLNKNNCIRVSLEV